LPGSLWCHVPHGAVRWTVHGLVSDKRGALVKPEQGECYLRALPLALSNDYYTATLIGGGH
jgi:hypothetical protein